MTALLAPDDILLSSTMNAWEQQVEALPGVTHISERDYISLRSYLDLYRNTDSYLTSPLYYYLTGRKGLWKYEKRACRVLFCWHPNREGQILIFNPLDEDSTELMLELLRIMPVPPHGLRIIRVKNDFQAQEIKRRLFGFADRKVRGEIVRESVLDWAYPVRVLSTTLVAQCKGKKFTNIRTGLAHAKNCGVRTYKFDAAKHLQSVRLLVDAWAQHFASTKEEYAELYDSYEAVFSLIPVMGQSLDGLVCFVEDRLQGVTLWEIGGDGKTANLFVNLCVTDYASISRVSIVSACAILSNQGIELLNLGGSETESLDFFKYRFRPVISVELSSIEVDLGLPASIIQKEFFPELLHA